MHPATSEEREKRRVQVDHRDARKANEEDRREDVIEACEDHELGADARDRRSHRRVRRRAVRVGPQREDGARHASERGPLQRWYAGMVRDHDRHARIELA